MASMPSGAKTEDVSKTLKALWAKWTCGPSAEWLKTQKDRTHLQHIFLCVYIPSLRQRCTTH